MSSVQFPAPVAAASSVAPVAAVSGTTASGGNNARTAADGQSAADAALLGAKGLTSAATAATAAAAAPTLASAASQLAASWPTAAAPTLTTPAVPAVPIPVLPQAQQTHISAQAREMLGAGFDPRGAASMPAAANANASIHSNSSSANNAAATTAGLSGGTRQAAPVTAAWPAVGLDAPLRHMVQSLVQQVTAQGGGQAGQQRVVAAQVWPLSLAHALESGGDDGEGSPLQTWLVRQGTVQTAEGPRGFTMTLRVPVPWLASLAAQAAPASPAAPGTASGLQAVYAGAPQNLQSGVLALVLQGMGTAAGRTSALLVLDFQPQLMAAGAAVYGRDLLQARHDPWVQQAQLQASGQLAKDEEIARQREREAGMCQAPGCPYALRAPCAQPFCLEMRVGTPLAAPIAVLDVIAGRVGTTGSVTRL